MTRRGGVFRKYVANKLASRPLLLAIIVVVVMVMYSFGTQNQSDEGTQSDEQRLAKILQQINEVGQVTVYFHYSEEQSTNLFQISQATTVSGVLIVAEGATSSIVKQQLQQSVSQVMQIPSHRIVIVPMQNKEEKKK